MFDDAVVKNPWVRAGVALGAIALVILLVYLLSPVLLPLFFAFIVAYILDPVVDVFERRKIPRSVTIGVLATLAIVFALAVPLFVIPRIISEAESLVRAAEAGFRDTDNIMVRVEAVAEKLPLESIAEAAGCAELPEVEGKSELAVLIECLALNIRERAVAFFQANADQIFSFGRVTGRGIASFLQTLGNSIVQVILFLANFALFAFVAGYLLKDYDHIITASKDLVPIKHRTRVFDITRRIDQQIRGFLRGQVIVCLCLGLMYAIGLSIANVPFAILIAAFGAVASFVPYLGLALTVIPALLLCLIQNGGFDWHFIAAILTFVIAQTIESTILTPKIVGDQVGLGPVWVILAVLVFGNAFGFLGLLMAVPIAAALKVLVVDALDYYRTTRLYDKSAPES